MGLGDGASEEGSVGVSVSVVDGVGGWFAMKTSISVWGVGVVRRGANHNIIGSVWSMSHSLHHKTLSAIARSSCIKLYNVPTPDHILYTHTHTHTHYTYINRHADTHTHTHTQTYHRRCPENLHLH